MDKWTKKYLKIARTVADDNDACYSRKIGAVLVSKNNRIISVGYNGTVGGCPHTDTPEFLQTWYNKIITDEDKKIICEKYGCLDVQSFVTKFAGQKMCPRRILDISSGQRLELCPCAHAERNCLASANKEGVCTQDSTMYCYCGVPCWECSQQIIQAGVKKVVCLRVSGKDYSVSSRYYLVMAGVELIFVNKEDIDS